MRGSRPGLSVDRAPLFGAPGNGAGPTDTPRGRYGTFFSTLTTLGSM